MRESSISPIAERLGTALKRKRESMGLSLAVLSKELGISSSTLSRTERKVGIPDANTIAILADWLEIPTERIFRSDLSKITEPDRPLPVIVREQLERDENLTVEGKEFLTRFFQTTYDQLVEVEENRRQALRS
ncbi:MAG TPA: helix-turn-helix transcriptional regulator [Pyrinomonadaceae bacterium]|nr:helix-turn-helix transcriptional regulator [Pyrinomonadaceae bacterium]